MLCQYHIHGARMVVEPLRQRGAEIFGELRFARLGTAQYFAHSLLHHFVLTQMAANRQKTTLFHLAIFEPEVLVAMGREARQQRHQLRISRARHGIERLDELDVMVIHFGVAGGKVWREGKHGSREQIVDRANRILVRACGCLYLIVASNFRKESSMVALQRLVSIFCLCVLLPASLALAQTPRDAALIEAAARGDNAALRGLIKDGASITARDASGRTALLAAVQNNRIEVARRLIGAGANVNTQDNIQDSPYLLAGARGHLEILKMTLAAGADLNSTNRYGGTALTPACHYGHVETVRELLKTAVAIDHVNHLGWTCLLEAVILGTGGAAHNEIVRMVVAAGANANLADRQGMSPLAHARSRGQKEIAAILVAAGAK